MKKIFLSHSSKDKPKVREIASFLKENGIYVWIDEAEIRIGDSLIKKITTGIYEVDYLFAFLSNNSINSNWVQIELEMAMNLEIKEKRVIVVPVLLEDCDIPGFLESKLYADMRTTSSVDQEYNSILRRLGIMEPPKTYKKKFTSRELTVIDFIEYYNSLELNSDKLLLLQSISDEKEMFWFKAFLEFYDNTLLNSDETPDEIFINALAILKDVVRFADTEIKARIRELINFPSLLNKSDSATLPIVISILSAIDYYSDEIFEKLNNIIGEHSNDECRDAIIQYFCTILKEDWYSSPNSTILTFSRKVFSMEMLKGQRIKKGERIAILTSNWTTDEHLKQILDIYFCENEQGKKLIIQGLVEHRYNTSIWDSNLKDRFYHLLSDVLRWEHEKDAYLVGSFLAYALSRRTDVFDHEQIYCVLSDKNSLVLEYFLDYLEHHEVKYITDSERDTLIEKTVQLIKKSENPRKRHMIEQVFYSFHDELDWDPFYGHYNLDEINSWVNYYLREN